METLRVVEIGSPVMNNSYEYGNESGCSTPYVSAPSSPGRSRPGFFFSAPTSPARSPVRPLPLPCRFEQGLIMEDDEASAASASPGGSGSDFEFSARFSEFDGSTVSADELFCNGQIRPMMPQVVRPLIEPEACGDFLEEESSRGRERGLSRDKSRHRRARSMSPLRSAPKWEAPQENEEEEEPEPCKLEEEDKSKACPVKKGRSGSKRWISLKDFLYRSKSEGRGHTCEKHWVPLSFSSSPAKQNSSSKKEPSFFKSKGKNKNAAPVPVPPPNSQVTRNSNGHSARRVPVSAHELHYTANRAQAEELRRKTYLPYRQGLFGCLGFTSKSYTTVNGFARSLHPALS